MAPKITATIDGLTETDFNRMDTAGAGSRYEVVLDWTDGDHHELELHFRLAEPTATRKLEPSGVHYAGGLEGGGPHLPLYELRRVLDLDITRLAKLLASIISLTKISPRVLGIPDGEGPEYKRVLDYLSGDDAG